MNYLMGEAMAKSPKRSAGAVDPAKLNQIIRWVVSGASEYEICDAIAKEFPGVDQGEMLHAAMRRVAENADVHPTTVAAWTFEAGRELYRRMVEANDFSGALKALKFLNDTAGYLATSKDEDDDDVREPSTEKERISKAPARALTAEPVGSGSPPAADGGEVARRVCKRRRHRGNPADRKPREAGKVPPVAAGGADDVLPGVDGAEPVQR
jgi:hypothetical protein